VVYICPKRVYFLRAIFTKLCLEEGAPGPHCRAKFQRCSFKTVAVRHQKLPKKVLLVKICPSGKLWGSIGKLEHKCTTTNLPLCNDTITVLKIVLLQIVSNFPLSQTSSFQSVTKNRQTKKNITLFCLQPASDPRSSPYLAW